MKVGQHYLPKRDRYNKRPTFRNYTFPEPFEKGLIFKIDDGQRIKFIKIIDYNFNKEHRTVIYKISEELFEHKSPYINGYYTWNLSYKKEFRILYSKMNQISHNLLNKFNNNIITEVEYTKLFLINDIKLISEN